MDEFNSTKARERQRMPINAWACASIVILLLVAALFNLVLIGGGYVAVHRASQHRAQEVTSIIVKSPIFIAGPAIEISLPAGCDLISAYANADGGNWWYQNSDTGHLYMLIAASRISLRQPDLNNNYFQRVIQIVERSSGDWITNMGPVQDAKAGAYSGRLAGYDIRSQDGASAHAVGLLVRRESDDLLVVLYGDDSVRDELDRAASEVFRSLQPRPTPQQYDVHSADVDQPVREDVSHPWVNALS